MIIVNQNIKMNFKKTKIIKMIYKIKKFRTNKKLLILKLKTKL